MKRPYSPFIAGPGGIGLLFFRLITGAALIQHGWPKIQHPFTWMGSQAFAGPVLQALSAVAEFGGGLCLILGFLTPLACLGVMCNMIIALSMVHWVKADPWVAAGHGPSFELALQYLASSSLLLTIGPGAYSLDRIMCYRRRSDRTKKRPSQSRQPVRQ